MPRIKHGARRRDDEVLTSAVRGASVVNLDVEDQGDNRREANVGSEEEKLHVWSPEVRLAGVRKGRDVKHKPVKTLAWAVDLV